MDYHQNARLTIHSREQLAKMALERGLTLKAAAEAFNVSPKTPAKWVHRLFRKLLHRRHVKHRFTRPYTPRTNGKAERFIQTALREWAYARSYRNSDERQQQLEPWLHNYNFHRPHSSLKLNSPASRSGLNRNNLLRLHI